MCGALCVSQSSFILHLPKRDSSAQPPPRHPPRSPQMRGFDLSGDRGPQIYSFFGESSLSFLAKVSFLRRKTNITQAPGQDTPRCDSRWAPHSGREGYKFYPYGY